MLIRSFTIIFEMTLSEILQTWYKNHLRSLPWRATSDPYHIWLSEILLQQTRVDQGLPYYIAFLEAFPSIHDLATAPEDKVIRLWEGLGYYSRARNLHKAAKIISVDFQGQFPNSYEALLKLPGVGPYTAAAIASFAFRIPKAVVDGNVYRFLARHFEIDLPIDKPVGQKYFAQLAEEILDQNHPDTHNQAMMEIGATVCTPTNPKCSACPVSDSCLALAHQTITDLPVKAGKTAVKEITLQFFIPLFQGSTWIQKRTESFWTGLHEFVPASELHRWTPLSYEELKPLGPAVTHLLSHRKLTIEVRLLPLEKSPEAAHYTRVDLEMLNDFAFPKPLRQLLVDKLLPLHGA